MPRRSFTPRRSFAFFVTFVAAGRALAQPAMPSPYDALVVEFQPYLDVEDPLGFGLKLKAVSGDEYTFWRGTKGRFFAWCGQHAGDWLADAADRVPAHGDLHFGNVGLYAAAPELGDLAFGMVDFDDAQQLPFQTELLHAFVTTRLVAARLAGTSIDANVDELDRLTLDAYRAALTSGRTATQLLFADSTVTRMAKQAAGAEYGDDLAKFCEVGGRFRVYVGKQERPSDLLDAIEDPARLDALAATIADACTCDAGLRNLLGTEDWKTVRGRLVSVARRVRLKSSGSQGLYKYVVRIWRPDGHDLILYLKQQIPSAAERAGYITPDERPAGERAAALVEALAHPRPIVNSFASFEGRSYLVSLREPWSDELDAEEVSDAKGLLHFCRLTGTVAGAAHGESGRGPAIAARLDDALARQLAERADAYVAEMRLAFASLRDDPRTRAAVVRADAAIAARTAPIR